MIDHSRVTSGYDAEILIGAMFFRRALEAFWDAGVVQENQDLGYGASATISRPTQVEIKTGGVRVPRQQTEDDWEPVPDTMEQYNIIIHIPATIHKPFGSDFELDARIYIRVQLIDQVNETTGLVNRVKMKTEYVTYDQASRDTIIAEARPFTDNIPDVEAEDVAFEVDKQLRRLLERDLTDQLIPFGVQKMAVRQLPAEPGFQACYAIYLNLNLKLGALYRVHDESFPPRIEVLPPEPDDQPVDRGDAAQGQNFLPLDRDVVLAAPPDLYQRLAINQMHVYTKKKEDGTYHRPLTQSGIGGSSSTVGYHKSLTINPVYLAGQPTEQLRVISETHIDAADVDVETRIYITPKIKSDGSLKMDIDVTEPEADTSFFDFLIFFIGGFIGLLLAPLTGGLSLIGYGMLSGLTFGMARLLTERYEEKGQEMVEKMVHSNKEAMLAFVASIPSRVTIVRQRVNPFYYHDYQVVTGFEEINVHADGMSFAGRVTDSIEDVDTLISSVKLVGRRRTREPIGDLTGLLYRVPRVKEIINVDQFNRPEPEREPDVFFVTGDEAKEMITKKQLKSAMLTPRYVRNRSGRITEIFFDTKTALAPFEAADLDIKGVLWVRGYKLILPRKGRPYYKSYPDKYPENNLSNQPAYICWRSRRQAEHFKDVNDALLDLALGDWLRAQQKQDPTDRHTAAISEAAYRMASTYPLIKELLAAIAEQQPMPDYTRQTLDNTLVNPDWPLDEMTPYDVENWAHPLGQEVEAFIASLDDDQLDVTAEIPFLDDATESTYWLADALIDYIWGRYNVVWWAMRDEKTRLQEMGEWE